MGILEALAIWRKVKPWLDKPWAKAILSALAKLFKNADKTPVLPKDHPDRKVTPEDILRSENNQV